MQSGTSSWFEGFSTDSASGEQQKSTSVLSVLDFGGDDHSVVGGSLGISGEEERNRMR